MIQSPTYNFKVEVLHKPKLKNSYIQVRKDKTVLIKTPINSKKFIEDFIQNNKGWIEKKLSSLENLITYDKELYSQEYILDRMVYFSQEMDLPYESVKFRKMKSRWGSCSSKKRITLNTHLQKLPLELIDYIVVHELAHLKHMNHSKAFHMLVASYLPQQKELRKKLKNIQIV